MSSGVVRRAQLIAPFGVGALTVVPDGTSIIAAGLDHWFEREDLNQDSQFLDLDEFRIEEWRLQAELRVSHFRLPPDWRPKRRFGNDVPNLGLSIPFQRFPTWNFCPRCYLLRRLPLSFRGKHHCENPDHRSKGAGRSPFVVQVPFVAICDYGHLRDFPWQEWVHRSVEPKCNMPMRLRSTGGASLSSQTVECNCGAKRTLARITDAESMRSTRYPMTTLSSELSSGGNEFLCNGSMPWHGEEGGRTCGRPLRGSLRAASNLYYALVKSAIYLPRAPETGSEKLIQILENPPLSTLISLLRGAGISSVEPERLREQQRDILAQYSDNDIRDALTIINKKTGKAEISAEAALDAEVVENGYSPVEETEFRRPEFNTLKRELRTPYLEIRQAKLEDYDLRISSYFSRLMLVDRLRETRALYGFNRIFPEGGWKLNDRKALLWKEQRDWNASWLPAYVVHGEGIFFELDPKQLDIWESSISVHQRVRRLASHFTSVQQIRGLKDRNLTPRFVLLHTLAHLLMNQLTFECGYSSAALRERLYVSSGPNPMAGVLIYTAAGDAEGTMGGLVRMGKPGYFEPTILRALDTAKWCSADPVCMEIGENGQGPDSCNMAACHSCALVPETACEEFNRFLDRGLVVGTHEKPELGFFFDI